MSNIPLAPFKGGIKSLIVILVVITSMISCKQSAKETVKDSNHDIYYDAPFIQEYHEAYMVSNIQDDNEIRSITVDHESNVWIATAAGVFRKDSAKHEWKPVITGDERGPAYSVALNASGDILLGTWNGLYRYRDKILLKEVGPEQPVSEICCDAKGDYALGPYGIWYYHGGG